MMQGRFGVWAGAGILLGVAAAASAQPLGGDTEWVTIGAVGNKGYDGLDPDPRQFVTGRGSVNYEYRMATTEITTGQWLEFMNTVNARNERGSFIFDPLHWGAEEDFSYTGPGDRFKLRADLGEKAARMPVAGMTWEDAARYCNWLHNGKQSDASTLGYGAYDASGFNMPGSGALEDQERRLPGAKFWIPSFDERLKAVHYDPEKVNEDGSVGGWWLGPYGSDELPLFGFPEDGGESSGGVISISKDFDLIPVVGAYETRTPWGLADASGGVSEWLEDPFSFHNGVYDSRWVDGSAAFGFGSDWAYSFTAEFGIGAAVGLRIASVPAPGSLCMLGFACLPLARSRRRH